MKTSPFRLQPQASSRVSALLAAAAVALLCAPAQAQDKIGPAPTIRDSSAMDPALVALLAELTAEIAVHPGDAAARGELGLAYEGNTIWSLAEECYDQALALAPDDTQWRFRRGVVRYFNGNLEGSIEDLRATAAVFKNTPVVQARLGDTLRIAGELEASEAAWRQAIVAEEKQTPRVRYAASRVGLAQVLLDLERPEEAAQLCEEAITIAPGYRHAHYTRGLALLELGNIEEAEIELSAGESAFPEFPPGPHAQKLAGYGRGFSRSMMVIENIVQAGKLEEAAARLEVIMAERPDDYLVLNLAARVAMRSGANDRARLLLTKSLDVAPDQSATLIELCLLDLTLANGFSTQLASAQQLAQVAPPGFPDRMAQIQAEIARVRTEGTEYAGRALTSAMSAVTLAPTVGRHHYWVGVCHQSVAGFETDQQKMGQSLQAALASFQMAQRLGCTEPSFNQQLATLYGQMGRGREMLKFALRHLDAHPADAGALGLVVRAYLSNGQKDQIAPYVRRMEKASAGNVPMLQFCVQGYLTVNDFESAERVLGAFEEAAAGNATAAQFVTAVQDHIRKNRPKAPGAGGQQ